MKNISYFPFLILLLIACSPKEEKTAEKPISKDSIFYVLQLNDQVLKINPNEGARIVSFQQSGNEIIGSGGSTFWTSPQSEWSWPPVKEHHNLPYTVENSGDSLVLTSQPDSARGLQIIKTFIPDLKDTSILVRYTIVNTSDTTRAVAPWENTRTFKTAVMLYPKGVTDSITSVEIFSKPLLHNVEGINWFTFDSSRTGGKEMGKLFAEGSEGWIANIYNGYVLIKKFPDIPLEQIAPGEGEIEIWADLGSNFMEMEQQGPYVTLQPGQKMYWEVKWYLRKLPTNVQAEEGNSELVSFIRNTIK
jgi:hypothetical protein